MYKQKILHGWGSCEVSGNSVSQAATFPFGDRPLPPFHVFSLQVYLRPNLHSSVAAVSFLLLLFSCSSIDSENGIQKSPKVCSAEISH